MNIPDTNVGVTAYGVKTGIITFDDDIIEVLKKTIKKNPGLIEDDDIVCITEAVVAITQHNVVELNDVAGEITSTLKLKKDSTIGLIHPILSRNRFSMILKAIARTVPEGKVIIQLKFPNDEQGNPAVAKEKVKKLNKSYNDVITLEEIGNYRLLHPETGMDYIDFYEYLIKEAGCEVEIYLANSVEHMVNKQPDAIIVSNVHAREEFLEDVKNGGFKNAITLQDIYSDPGKKIYSDFGLLGSNVLDPVKEQLKLCPRKPDEVCENIKKMIKTEFNKDVEVIINGDGAYKDPESGIYELADPVSCFGCTSGIKNKNRVGVKTKYLMQKLYNEGKTREEIAKIIEEEKKKFVKKQQKQGFSAQGTTPRKIENLVSSLADLISGSGDSNTPVIVVRGFA